MKELTKRILFAVPAAIVFISAMWMGGWYFNALIIVIGLLTQHEVIKLLNKAGTPVDTYFPLSIGLWIMLFPVLPLAFEIGLIIFLLFVGLQTFNDRPTNFSELTSTFFASIYAPLGFLCLMLVRGFGPAEQAFLLTLTVVLMVWLSDIFAYFGGKIFGKYKLAPSISPNKTVEGFISGFVGCFVALCIVVYATPLNSPITLLSGGLLIFAIGFFGPMGDLLESKIKRKANVKDSSNILPGHGGFFDRFDALIPASVAGYAYFSILEHLGYVIL